MNSVLNWTIILGEFPLGNPINWWGSIVILSHMSTWNITCSTSKGILILQQQCMMQNANVYICKYVKCKYFITVNLIMHFVIDYYY